MSARHVVERMCPGGCGVTMTLEDHPSPTGFQIHERLDYHRPCGLCEEELDGLLGLSVSDVLDGNRARLSPLGLLAGPRRWATIGGRTAHRVAHALQARIGFRYCRLCHALTSNAWRPIQFSRQRSSLD